MIIIPVSITVCSAMQILPLMWKSKIQRGKYNHHEADMDSGPDMSREFNIFTKP